MRFNDGSVIVQYGSIPLLVIEVIEAQNNDPIFL